MVKETLNGCDYACAQVLSPDLRLFGPLLDDAVLGVTCDRDMIMCQVALKMQGFSKNVMRGCKHSGLFHVVAVRIL